MRVRIVQRKDDDEQWFDDSYALEDHAGRMTFHYHLTWEKIGARYNGKLQETGISLDENEN